MHLLIEGVEREENLSSSVSFAPYKMFLGVLFSCLLFNIPCSCSIPRLSAIYEITHRNQHRHPQTETKFGSFRTESAERFKGTLEVVTSRESLESDAKLSTPRLVYCCSPIQLCHGLIRER